MPRLFHTDRTMGAGPEELPVRFLLLTMVAAISVLLLAIFSIDFRGLERLLPDGELFVPYFTT
jgi:hypothetical protein